MLFHCTHLCFYFRTPAPVAVGSHGAHVRVAAPLHHPPTPLLHLVVLVPFVLLVPTLGIEVDSMDSLDMLSEGAWVCVALGTSRGLAHIRFLGEIDMLVQWAESQI